MFSPLSPMVFLEMATAALGRRAARSLIAALAWSWAIPAAGASPPTAPKPLASVPTPAASAPAGPVKPVSARPAAATGQAGSAARAPALQVMRWVDVPEGAEHLDTAILHFVRGRQRVDLIGAVHIADKEYYQTLKKKFAGYDRLLFEMVKPDELDVGQIGHSDSQLSTIQRWLRDQLNLYFQLDEIDYTASNFVHADIDSELLGAQLRAHAADILGSLLVFSVTDAARLQHADGSPRLGTMELLIALSSPDRPRALKRFVGRELAEVDLGGEEFGGFGIGSVLIRERNAVAIRVLKVELGKKHKKLAIFYGAAHLSGLAHSLEELGFVAAGQEWLQAWQMSRGRGPQR